MSRILLVGVQAAQRLAPFLNFLWTPLERFCVRAATTTTTTPPGFFPCYRDAFERVNAAERLARKQRAVLRPAGLRFGHGVAESIGSTRPSGLPELPGFRRPSPIH